MVEGLVYRQDFITPDEERQLLGQFEAIEFRPVVMRGQTARRTVRHYGLDYDYESGELVPAEPLPEWMAWLRDRSAALMERDRSGSGIRRSREGPRRDAPGGAGAHDL
jgi:alkylated DNA repair protein (DNA oxidative demethylase)